MKIKHLLLATVAVVAGLSSCSKDHGGSADGDFDFYLKIERETATRADANQVPDQTDIQFGNGAVFFTDTDGNIIEYVRVAPGGAGVVTPSQLDAGHLFKGISSAATYVHVVGNYDFSGIISLGKIDDLSTETFTLADMKDDDYGLSKATLYSAGPIVAATSTKAINAGANREAEITLAPILSRLELKQVRGDATVNGTDSTGDYELKGIYIDNFYYESSIVCHLTDLQEIVYNDAATASGTYPDVASYLRYSRFNDNNTSTYGHYSDPDWYPILFDDGDVISGITLNGLGSAGSSNEVKPAKEAWVYNFFPVATYTPHIVLHLTGVEVYDSGTNNWVLRPNPKTGTAGEAYLTVTNYKKTGTDDAVKIEGGYIYVINDLLFTEDNLRNEPKEPDPDPDKNPLDVFVTVKLMKRTTVDVDVEFNYGND